MSRESRALTSSGVEALRSHIKGLPLVDTGSSGARLRVRLESNKPTSIMHPTWGLKYLPNGPTFGRNESDEGPRTSKEQK